MEKEMSKIQAVQDRWMSRRDAALDKAVESLKEVLVAIEAAEAAWIAEEVMDPVWADLMLVARTAVDVAVEASAVEAREELKEEDKINEKNRKIREDLLEVEQVVNNLSLEFWQKAAKEEREVGWKMREKVLELEKVAKISAWKIWQKEERKNWWKAGFKMGLEMGREMGLESGGMRMDFKEGKDDMEFWDAGWDAGFKVGWMEAQKEDLKER